MLHQGSVCNHMIYKLLMFVLEGLCVAMSQKKSPDSHI